MPSAKVTQILLARSELNAEKIGQLTEAEAWRRVYALPKPTRSTTARLAVCFTGFGSQEKEELASLALRAGHHVTTSVTKKLGLLVCGDNAGPAKLEKAAQQGVAVVSSSEYRDLARELASAPSD